MTLQRAILSRGLSNGTSPSRGYRAILDGLAVAVQQKVAFKDSVTITIHKAVDQKLGIKPTATDKIDSVIRRTVTQKLGIKPKARPTRFPKVVTQVLRIKPRATIGTTISVDQKVGIKPHGTALNKVKKDVEQKLSIKAIPSVVRTIHRNVKQTLGMKGEVHLSRKFVNITKKAFRIFKVITDTTRYRT